MRRTRKPRRKTSLAESVLDGAVLIVIYPVVFYVVVVFFFLQLSLSLISTKLFFSTTIVFSGRLFAQQLRIAGKANNKNSVLAVEEFRNNINVRPLHLFNFIVKAVDYTTSNITEIVVEYRDSHHQCEKTANATESRYKCMSTSLSRNKYVHRLSQVENNLSTV